MGYTLSNPTSRDIIANQLEGHDYHIPAGGKLEVESYRAALSLVDYGAHLSSEDKVDAVVAEVHRQDVERSDEGATMRGTDADKTPTPTPGGSVVVGAGLAPHLSGDASALKGAELDSALAAAGLPTGGKVAEKRARLAEHLATTADVPAKVEDVQGVQDGTRVVDVAAVDADDPLAGMSDEEVAETLAAFDVVVDDTRDAAEWREELRTQLGSNS